MSPPFLPRPCWGTPSPFPAALIYIIQLPRMHHRTSIAYNIQADFGYIQEDLTLASTTFVKSSVFVKKFRFEKLFASTNKILIIIYNIQNEAQFGLHEGKVGIFLKFQIQLINFKYC